MPASNTWSQQQKNTPIFYHISEQDGLPDNVVNCFFQDSRGVMWLGTSYGLCSFDGSTIKTVQSKESKDDSHKFFSMVVNSIAEDDQKNVWLATEGGLTRYNLITGEIKSYAFKTDLQGVNQLKCVVYNNGIIWAGGNNGLLKFDIKKEQFVRYSNDNNTSSKLPVWLNNNIRDMLMDKQHHLWIATGNGLWLFHQEAEKFECYDSPDNDSNFDELLNTVFQDHAGKLWMGCWNRGLKEFDMQKHIIGHEFAKNANSNVASIAEQKNIDGTYQFWLAGGLKSFNPVSRTYSENISKQSFNLEGGGVQKTFVSRDNLLWVSTDRGVYIMDVTKQLFKQRILSDSALSTQGSGLLVEKNRIWIGGHAEKSLLQLNLATGEIENRSAMVNYKKKEQLVAPMVMQIHRNNDRLWFATNEGMVVYNELTGVQHAYVHNDKDSNSFPRDFIINIFFTPKGEIWVFPWRKGVWKLDEQTQHFAPVVVTLPTTSENKRLNIDNATADDKGNIWLADLDEGIIKFDAASHTFKRIVNEQIPEHARVSNVVFYNGKVWAVEHSIVLNLDPITDKMAYWPMPKGWDKYVYSFVIKNNILWITSRTGLLSFDIQQHTFKRYNEADGIVNNNMDGRIMCGENANIFFVSNNYLTSFNPSSVLSIKDGSTLLLSNVEANDKQILFDNEIADIPYGIRNISFSWALLHYSNPLQNHYYCFLEGADKVWQDAGNKGIVTYNSLAAGTYTFHYKAATSDGQMSREQTIKFTVLMPFWQTWWFRILLFSAVLCSILLVIRNVRNRERRKANLQKQMVELEMKALRAQMNPHFIFNALNSIQECVVMKNTDAAYTYLSKFSKLVRMILDQSGKPFITLQDEMQMLELYVSIEELRFNKGLAYTIECDDASAASFTKIPSMIVQPYVENALWHGLANKDGDKKLNISFVHEQEYLVCKIEDNGIGREAALQLTTKHIAQKKSMGMKITKERLSLLDIKASVNIEDVKDTYGNATGTIVLIKIPYQY
jgi:ligand-binding sensor domain-containing protein